MSLIRLDFGMLLMRSQSNKLLLMQSLMITIAICTIFFMSYRQLQALKDLKKIPHQNPKNKRIRQKLLTGIQKVVYFMTLLTLTWKLKNC